MPSTVRDIIARRAYRATPEMVFRAFTEPALLSRWFSPSADIPVEVLAFDLVVGGRYRIAYRLDEHAVTTVTGAFREITTPMRLVFTWTWEPPDPHAGIDTLVTIDIASRGPLTELTVRHEQFPDDASRDRHDDGWRTTLDRLDEVLA
jgi:uncharacterized protein YndB with AHSA1/START domain